MKLERIVLAALAAFFFSSSARPQNAPTGATGASAATGAASGAATGQGRQPTFDVFEYQVEGNTTLDQESIERAVYPFLGPAKTIADIDGARAALETRYHDKGFGTVRVLIPEQKVTGGVVRLEVAEGKVEKLEVVNSKYFSQGRILDTVKSLKEGQVPNLLEAQQELAQVNAPDHKVTPIVTPGKAPGTTDVDLEVSDSLPLHGSVTLDDYYSPMTKALRLSGALEYDNMFQRDQKLSLLYQTSPQDQSEVKLFSLGYTIPIAGQYLALSFVRSDSATLAGVGGVDIFGRGKIIGVHDVVPLNPPPDPKDPTALYSQTFTFGADYKDFDQNVTVGSSTGSGFATPVRYVPFSGVYSLTTGHPGSQWDFSGTLEFALRDFGNTAAQFDAKRYQALSNFAVLKFQLDRLQPLPANLSFFGRLDLQFADQPLVSNEQLVVGGNDSVRGYLVASEAGDSGARTTLELRSSTLIDPSLFYLTSLETHLFADGAYVRIFSPLPAQTPAFELVSTGLGLRARRGSRLSIDLDLAWPMRSVLDTRAWSPRLQGAATLAF
jgi:hemolysin activation/secretion protein